MSAERREAAAWTVRPIGDLVHCPARLREATFDLGPSGTVHEALVAAGVLAHPDEPGGEEAQEWIGRTDWAFATWLRADRALLACERVELVVDHVDTLGDVLVNGVRVASTANEFVPLRIPVRAFLRAGVNEIEIRLRGPVAAVLGLERRLGPRPVNGDWTPFPFLRKSACNFGWDWGPRVPTAGVGRIALEGWSGARIAELRPLVTRCDETSATVRVAAAIDRSAPGPWRLRCTLESPDGHIEEVVADVDEERSSVDVEIAVATPHRWWPRGHGDQPLYRLTAALERACGEVDRRSCRIGLRTVELERVPDEAGESFTIRVNGRPIWCRGANWIPVDLFPRDVPDARVEAWLDAAHEANLTMLRVWGGGIYEREAFYDRCDELGLLVWQDFMFACATYPEDEPYPALVEAEARHQVARLSSHPSVVLWCGGNEDILAWWSWGWRERLAEGQTWGRRYWLELLPRVVAELDPTRPYWPESPYSGSMEVHPNEPGRGDRHTWDAKLEAYRTIVPRFCSEFGQQSPPSTATLAERVPSELLGIGSEELARRQRAWGGDAFQYAPLLAERFPPVATLDEWILATQLLQARAYEIAIGWMRANAPRCMGALFWQWNDVWRGHSWSVWDIAGRPKPAWFAVRRACAPMHLSIRPGQADRAATLVLACAAGECGEPPVEAHVRLVDGTGRPIDERSVRLVGRGEWTSEAALPDAWFAETAGGAGTDRLVVADAGGLRTTHRFAHDRDARLPAPVVDVVARSDEVEVRAESLLVDLCLLAELGGAMRSRAVDGMVTLLPGETMRIPMRGEPIDARTARRALRTANDVGRGVEMQAGR